MTSLCRPVLVPYLGQLEYSPDAALPVAHRSFEQTIATPKKVPRV
jgi:hypothetical protein